MPEKLKSLPPMLNQICLRKLGMYCSERLMIDDYYLLEVVNLLISYFRDEEVAKIYKEEGKDWEKTKVSLLKLNRKIAKAKTWYDAIENKRFTRKTLEPNKVQFMIKRMFTTTLSKISLMKPELYDAFVILTSRTTMQMQQIRSEAFKILEHARYRTLNLDTKTSTPIQPQVESTNKES